MTRYEEREWNENGIYHYERFLTLPSWIERLLYNIETQTKRVKQDKPAFIILMLTMIWCLLVIARVSSHENLALGKKEILLAIISGATLVFSTIMLALRRKKKELEKIVAWFEDWKKEIFTTTSVIAGILGLIFYFWQTIAMVCFLGILTIILLGAKKVKYSPVTQEHQLLFKAKVNPLAFFALGWENMPVFKKAFEQAHSDSEEDRKSLGFGKRIIRILVYPIWLIFWRILGWKHIGYVINTEGKFSMCEAMDWSLFSGISLRILDAPVSSLVLADIRMTQPLGIPRISIDYQVLLRDVKIDPQWLGDDRLKHTIDEMQKKD